MAVPSAPRPFAAFEWLIAWRYLRARRKEGGISVIAGYALVGVMLGVATLIVVQAVMIGFREEFTDRILGAS
ncbi:MAG TPA: lipoprotein-releasing system transmembrane subunit LolC, partial [Amaricoccus sp.]|nr:lipoprotein-releasing system transmembrane subunit LolC [Amaricoccus sp.]